MPTARKYTVVPGQPGFFHCVSRCVRRAWLCGTDPVTGKNYDHRREWMLERMRLLTTCFAMDVYAYALMSNHYHIVFYIDPHRVNTWSDEEVIKKWKTLWNWRNPGSGPSIPKNVPNEVILLWRRRLADVSWVMRLLNEPMARIANAEDDVKGHFWESRFKCNALLDDQGLTTCMVYADLNPIKAGIAQTPEQSDYTSIQQRIRDLAKINSANNTEPDSCETVDERFVSSSQGPNLRPISSADPELAPTVTITLQSYVELVESTAKALRQHCVFSSTSALVSLGIKPSGWMQAVKGFTSLFRTAAGTEKAYSVFMERTNRTRRHDASARRLLFSR